MECVRYQDQSCGDHALCRREKETMIVKCNLSISPGHRKILTASYGTTFFPSYEIQLEPALSELKTLENLRPFGKKNPHKDALLKTQEFISLFRTSDQITPDPALNKKAIFSRVHEIDLALSGTGRKEEILLSRRAT